MTIDESHGDTIVRCDRCGQVIETNVDSSFSSGVHKSDQSATSPTTADNTADSDNSQVEQVGFETKQGQSEKNVVTSSDPTVVANDNPTAITKNNKQGSRDIIEQLNLNNLLSDSNAVASNNSPTGVKNESKHVGRDLIEQLHLKNLPSDAIAPTPNLPDNSNTDDKVDVKGADDFTIGKNVNAKKSTIIIDDQVDDSESNRVKSSKNIGTLEVSSDAETILSSHSGKSATNISPARNSSGSANSSDHLSDSGRFGSTINLDLTKRVMGTINKSDIDAADDSSVNVGGYGVHRILKQHQRGGMGRIMIAYDQHLKRDVALKELHKEVVDDISIVRRFVGEAEITAQLEHPGIVPIHWLGLDKDGLPYYTMKLIKGKTYQDAIKDYHRNPSKQELKSLVRRLVSICKTIGFAHERGVIHRDLKPANIMLGEHGETLVMDWGLAKPLHQNQREDVYNTDLTKMTGEARTELTMVGAIVGTPAFMSPEQASPEESVVGTHSDIYSLGTILYYLLAGQTAFAGRSTREVLAKVRAASPTRPSEIKLNVPAGLEAICMKAMAKNPKDRYQTAKEMDEDLCRWLDDIPVKAMRIMPIQKFFRWIIRHWVAAISVPLMAILAIMLAIFVIQYDRSYNASAFEEARRIALEDEVDLTEQSCVVFRGGNNIDVTMEPRLTGGNMIVCKLKRDSDVNAGLLEILAPSGATWDLSKRRKLKFSVFEYHSGSILPLDNLKIRLGRGSAYFEYQPSKATTDWWAQRRHGNWCTYLVPIDGSQDWHKTISGNPQIETIDWIEFHFNSRHDDQFQLDDIMFLKSEE
ncbi:MAG: protein kinase [Planctomycetaceae bacterium]|jgi:tRNA A-37 threonylcarbamoyl transferase component Bud32|nr:protein kinase [Planctomycetaceae bacterium]